ncbi:MAG TPA: 30S ribosomal protein S6 [Rhodospirillaceae bacterium]|jgi:small subunit ribosomal protein S6|nr:30S ribosomal protein S6 [Alphaproteobacteria bacterium]HBH26246.1 30S ribosomal protein S6 [Rhodospirillaceae bacterium]
MPVYETVFIARQDLGEAQVEELSVALQKVITDQGGKILKTESWGLRTLAYRINKNRRGHYVLIEHETPGVAVAELERQMRLNEDVLRALTVKLEAPSTAPSPIIARRERDDDHKDTRKREAA